MSQEKRQGFLKGAAILSVSTIIVKLVGLLFTIPLGNIMDSNSMSYYSAAYTIFALFNAAATAGLPVAISRMVSSSYAQNRLLNTERIFKVAFTVFFAIGLVFSASMFLFSDQIAIFMKNPNATYSIKALAPTVFFCAVMSAIRGYFQGRSNMTPTAISQVIESITKILFGISLAVYVLNTTGKGEYASAAAIVGISISAGLGTAYLLIYKLRQYRKEKVQIQKASPIISSQKGILKSMVQIAVPITLGACFLYLLDFIDYPIIMGRLQDGSGLTEKMALSLSGIWSFAVKIFDLPGAIIIALSTSLLPILTAAITRNDKPNIKNYTYSSLRITLLVSIPSCFGLMIFSKPLANLIYFNKPETANGVAPLLALLGVGVVFNGLLYMTNSILQSFGRIKTPVINMAIGGILRIVLNMILVGIPQINIMGAAISMNMSYLITTILNLIAVYRVAKGIPNILFVSFPIIVSSLVMSVVSYTTYWALSLVISSRISVVIAIFVAIAVYFISVVFFKVLQKKDIMMLPKGEKIAKFLHL